MFKKEKLLSIVVAAFGGGISLFLAGNEKAGGIIGFLFLGFIMGIAIGILKKSLKRAVVATIICMGLSVVSMFIGSVAVLVINPHSMMLKAAIFGVVIGIMLGGGMGAIAGYDSGEKLIIDSLETTLGGIIGGSIAMPIIVLGYETKNSAIFAAAGIVGGIIFALSLIVSLEIAERNEDKQK